MDNKILFLTRHFPPPFRGGTYVYYYYLYKYFKANVLILAPLKKNAHQFDVNFSHPILRLSYFKEFPSNKREKFFILLKLIKDIVILFRKGKFTPLEKTAAVTHWHSKHPSVHTINHVRTRNSLTGFTQIHIGQFYPEGLIGLILKKIFKIPYLLFLHGEDISQFYYRFHGLRFLLAKSILRNSEILIANSEYTIKITKKILPNVFYKIFKLSPSVDKEKFNPNVNPAFVRKKYNINGKKIILSVGRLVPQKGHATMLSILSKLSREFKDLVYIIVGDGEGKTSLHNLAKKLSIEDKVIFTGYVDYKILPYFYSSADIFIHPNYDFTNLGLTEGYGMVIKEAMSSGVAVIGGSYGGVKEIINHKENGLLVDTRNQKEVEDSLKLLLGNEVLRKKLGISARLSIERQLSWYDISLRLSRIILGNNYNLNTQKERRELICQEIVV
jgi:phosphatidylinositol alpha-1,6-mannosyltransferase